MFFEWWKLLPWQSWVCSVLKYRVGTVVGSFVMYSRKLFALFSWPFFFSSTRKIAIALEWVPRWNRVLHYHYDYFCVPTKLFLLIWEALLFGLFLTFEYYGGLVDLFHCSVSWWQGSFCRELSSSSSSTLFILLL